jgi:TonB family protein
MQAFDMSDRNRLLLGVGISVLVHFAAIGLVRPKAYVFMPAAPIQLQIVNIPAESKGSIGSRVAPYAQNAEEGLRPPREEESPRNGRPQPERAGPQRFQESDYTDPRHLDVRAEPLNDVHLVYPQQAYQWRVKGRVLLQLLINDLGRIDKISVLESEPPGIFEAAALEAAWATVFSPALKSGNPVRSKKTIEVKFDPYESIHTP